MDTGIESTQTIPPNVITLLNAFDMNRLGHLVVFGPCLTVNPHHTNEKTPIQGLVFTGLRYKERPTSADVLHRKAKDLIDAFLRVNLWTHAKQDNGNDARSLASATKVAEILKQAEVEAGHALARHNRSQKCLKHSPSVRYRSRSPYVTSLAQSRLVLHDTMEKKDPVTHAAFEHCNQPFRLSFHFGGVHKRNRVIGYRLQREFEFGCAANVNGQPKLITHAEQLSAEL